MAKRKTTRRKAPSRSRGAGGSGVSRLWWGAGIVAVGAILFDANRDALLPPEPVKPRAQVQAARPTEPAPARAAKGESEPRPAAVPRQAERPAPRPPAPVPAAPARPATASTPVTSASSGGFVTARRAPVRTTPKSGAPVFVILEKGRPLRVTAREGDWRRVEAGIFSGWVEAADLAPQSGARAGAPRPVQEASRPALTPRASVPGG